MLQVDSGVDVNSSSSSIPSDEREDSTFFFRNQVHLVEQELKAVRAAINARDYRARERKQTESNSREFNAETVQVLRLQLDAALAELESMPPSATVPGKELLGKVVQIKVKGVVPDHYRDLAVDLGVHKGYPGYTVFEALTMCQEAMGASVINVVEDSNQMFTSCLLERAIILQDDQARRMAEERRTGDPLQIRLEPRSQEEQQHFEAAENT